MTKEEQTDWLCRLRADLNNGVIFTPWNKEFTVALTDILEPVPKTGYWIGGDGNYICSCCRYDPLDSFEPLGLDGGSYMAVPMKYCPNCGAKMTEEE